MTVSRLTNFRGPDSIVPNSLNKEFNNLVYSINSITAGGSSITPTNTYIILSPQSTAPSPQPGMIYFNSVDNQFYGSKDGSTWNILG